MPARLDADTIRSEATGKWRNIFSTLSIEVPATAKQHGPCPACGGKDRFRCDDKDGRGTFYCNQCDPRSGDGFMLIQNVRRCSFPDALHLVAGVLDIDPHARRSRGHLRAPRPPRINRIALAFRFELGALDLRLRAERIIETGKTLDVDDLSDQELDLAIGHVAQAYHDRERAELFEHVADTLRERDFTEKENRKSWTTHAH